MRQLIARALFASVVAAAIAQAQLPTTYRLALIQVAYSDGAAKYTKDQLIAAAKEITDFYSGISYGNLKLDIAVSVVTPGSLGVGASKSNYFSFGGFGVATPTPSNEAVVGYMAGLARLDINFSHIDGIAIVNGFEASADFVPGVVTIPSPSPVAGTYESAYFFERSPDPRLSPPSPSGVFWDSWAHWIGYMLEIRSGTVLGGAWDGHPSAEASGYDLMDLCYPCSPGAYSVLGAGFMTGEKRVFNGWLPNHQVFVMNGEDTRTSLAPLTAQIDYLRVIKVPITSRIYYLVEARQRRDADALATNLSPRGLWDEGVHITRVDEGADPPVHVINSCDSTVPGGCVKGTTDPRFATCHPPQGYSVETLPRYCWPFPLFHEGDTFHGENGIQVSVLEQFTLRGSGGTSAWFLDVKPNPFFVPDVLVLRRDPTEVWKNLNYSGHARHQLWIDSSCNGYASDVGPAGLRFGDPAHTISLAVGDDLCLGHENRLYARIENRGTAPARGLRVHFDVGDPAAGQGVCNIDRCPSTFVEVGVADAQHFPALASLAPGAQATVYVPYTPPASNGGAHFTTPALRVRIDPLPNEISTGDNVAESEFGRVEAVLGNFREANVQTPDFVYTTGAALDVFVNRIGALPAGVTVSTGQSAYRVSLVAGQQLHLPIEFTVSGQTAPAAGRYAANITLSAFVPVPDPVPSGPQRDYKVIAARTVGIDVVEPSRIDLRAQMDDDAQGVIEVQGKLQAGRRNAVIALDYTGRDNKPATLVVRTDDEGEFEARLLAAPGSRVSALWAGDETHAPAAAGPVAPTAGH